MRRHHHVGRLLGQRVVDDARVDLLQAVRIVAALARLLQFVRRTEIGPHGIVELQIAAAGIVECLHRLAVGLAKVEEELLEIGIDLLRNRPAAAPEMQHRGGDGIVIFARDMRRVGMLLQEAEVIQHRMVVGEIELADHANGVVPGLDARELDARVRVGTIRSR